MKFTKIHAKADKNITLSVAQGHFATNHSHISHCVDLTEIKTHHKIARRAAAILSEKYHNTQIDTIISLEGTDMLGAFLAEELARQDHMSMNSGTDICVVTPDFNSNNQMIFLDNMLPMISGASILLLLASVSTGKTINRAVECLRYYNARLSGIGAMFSAAKNYDGMIVNSVFTLADLPDYRTFPPAECELCKSNVKIDAIVNSTGYSKLR